MRVQKLREEAVEKERDEHFKNHPAGNPDEARVEGVGEDQCPSTHGF
jgi:hypothetical protein